MANYPFKIGKATVNITEGGITNAEVIVYAEQLPTATVDSPNFVQTPNGTLYRKKAVGGGVDGVITSTTIKGVFEIKSYPAVTDTRVSETINFSSNNASFTTFFADFTRGETIKYGGTTVYNGTWTNTAYQTVNFGNIEQDLTPGTGFYEYFTQVASSVSPSVSYEYVAMQEVPTPTTADNGKVLGVTNGAYALQEVGGSGKAGFTLTVKNDFQNTELRLLLFASDGTSKTVTVPASTTQEFEDVSVYVITNGITLITILRGCLLCNGDIVTISHNSSTELGQGHVVALLTDAGIWGKMGGGAVGP